MNSFAEILLIAIFMSAACALPGNFLVLRRMSMLTDAISGLPQKYIGECHSINVVYSNTLDKWIWIDPTNNAWVMDENGIMLSVQEVRERLRDGRPVILNEEANWNNQQKITKEYYLDSYMAKNLYSIKADDVLLCPSDPNAENFFQAKYVVNDDTWFWQSPYQE